FCDRNASGRLVVLAVFAGCASKLTPELAREVALIREAAAQRDPGQRFVRVNQRAAGYPQAELPQIPLRREMKARVELTLEGAQRHLRGGGELLVADRALVVIAHVFQRRPEALGGSRMRGRPVQDAGDSCGPDDLSFGVKDRHFVGHMPTGSSPQFP